MVFFTVHVVKILEIQFGESTFSLQAVNSLQSQMLYSLQSAEYIVRHAESKDSVAPARVDLDIKIHI